jgi:putative peptide zinc metalloprotease protein
MKCYMRRLALILLTALLTLALAAGTAQAHEEKDTATLADTAVAIIDRGGNDNIAVEVNSRDGSLRFESRFSVIRVTGDVVDETNAAIASSSCESCRTVVIAIQVVLVTGDPGVVTPTNLAVAANEGCTNCETLASAYQFVKASPNPVRFTPEGDRRIAAIRHQLKDLRTSGLSIEETQARVGMLAAELQDVLATELVAENSN